MKQQVRFCRSVDGARIALAESGNGPPLVRMANWFTHLDLDRQSAVWRHWFDLLADGRTLVRYDPRGSGLSDRNVDDFSLDRWIDDLDAVVECAGLTRFPLIGLCQGGVVAAAYAARYPDRVSRLILYDSYSFGAYAKDVPERLTREARALAQMIEVGWGKEHGAFREVFANLLMPEAGKDALRWLGEMQRQSASARDARLLWDAFNKFDIREVAVDIAAPTLVFHGVARGLGNRDLADLLRISEKTVRNHITTIFSKLDVASRAQAIVAARDAGLGRD